MRRLSFNQFDILHLVNFRQKSNYSEAMKSTQQSRFHNYHFRYAKTEINSSIVSPLCLFVFCSSFLLSLESHFSELKATRSWSMYLHVSQFASKLIQHWNKTISKIDLSIIIKQTYNNKKALTINQRLQLRKQLKAFIHSIKINFNLYRRFWFLCSCIRNTKNKNWTRQPICLPGGKNKKKKTSKSNTLIRNIWTIR